jgi:hypothetical protein
VRISHGRARIDTTAFTPAEYTLARELHPAPATSASSFPMAAIGRRSASSLLGHRRKRAEPDRRYAWALALESARMIFASRLSPTPIVCGYPQTSFRRHPCRVRHRQPRAASSG